MNNGYKVIEGFLGLEFTQFVEQYFITRFSSGVNVHYGDNQSPRCMSIYGDPLGDTILKLCTDHVSTIVGKQLLPTVSFTRLYHRGDHLKVHLDRPSCEYSATLCLAYPSGESPSPIYFNDKKTPTDAHKVVLKRGDLCIYEGCKYYHWRDPIETDYLLQVFLHWVDSGGEYRDMVFDNRGNLGIMSK
tara:strand:- start:226 stop:789 length:564 start_codon:yes stop_codon:yes gene_type:complete